MNAKTLLSAALSAVLAAPALAGDVGEQLQFSGEAEPSWSHSISAAGDLVFESIASAPSQDHWDTVLFHGEMSGGGLAFEVSREVTPGMWSAFVPARAVLHPNGRFWAKAHVGAGGRGALRLRAVTTGSLTGQQVRIFSVEVFQGSDVESVDATAAPPRRLAAPNSPQIHGRARWNARPPKADYDEHAPDRMTIHHTDGNQPFTLTQTLQEVKFIQDFHMNGRGWTDIAYHYLIDGSGNVVEGRPENVMGAHAGNPAANRNNLGIVLMGKHHPPRNDGVSEDEYAALLGLARYLQARYRINPRTLKGHRDYKRTDCPGNVVYPRVLNRLKADLQRPAPAAPAVPGAPNRILFRPTLLVKPAF